jgi:RHS repeat-associated protein
MQFLIPTYGYGKGYFTATNADPNMTVNASLQPYKYNGKELDMMHGLKTYDYGARQYNPITGRWDRVDKLAEKYYPFTPYSYCAGDPVNKFDPDGKIVVLADGVSESFRKDYELTIKTFSDRGCNETWEKLNNSDKIYTVTESPILNKNIDPQEVILKANPK